MLTQLNLMIDDCKEKLDRVLTGPPSGRTSLATSSGRGWSMPRLLRNWAGCSGFCNGSLNCHGWNADGQSRVHCAGLDRLRRRAQQRPYHVRA